jgi:2'-5' RNA ligase
VSAPILPTSAVAPPAGVPHPEAVQPLIVTLTLDDAAQQRFDALREAHFPRERNHLQAHVTLFHALPGEQEEQVRRDLAEAADRPAFPVRVSGLRSLGRGVAYVLDSPDLARVRTGLRERWQPWLTPQDAAKHSPHVTVQNKVAPEQARALLTQLEAAFVPYDVTATGLALWRYLGGPWEPLSRERFSSG